MREGKDGSALRRAADRLRAEFADPSGPAPPFSRLSVSVSEVGALYKDDETLVEDLWRTLASMAASPAEKTDELSKQTVQFVLDGAEFVTRSELAAGRPERILELLPSFVYLVMLPVSDKDRALDLSQRTAELIDR